MPSPDQMIRQHQGSPRLAGIAGLLPQSEPDLAAEVAALRREIAALRALKEKAA